MALKKAEALRGRLVGETGLKAMSGQEQKSSGAVAVNGDKAEKIPEMIETTAEEGLKDVSNSDDK